MSCTPTRILLSNSAVTTMNVTLATDPGDGTTVTFQVDGLSINESEVTASGVAVFTIAANAGANNSLWDGTIQVVETNGAQTIGVTLSDAGVSYCSPLAGGGGSGVTSLTGGSLIDVDQSTGAVTASHAPKGAAGIATGYPGSITIDSFGHVVLVGATSTPVIPTNNLSDLASDSAARTNLGLTAAATTAIGSSAGDLIVLDAYAEVPLARLPALAAAYTGQIETIVDKTYTIDPGVVAGRTITSFYARSGAGTCTATLKNAALTVGVVSVTTSSTTAVISNTTVAADSALTIVVTSNVAATDVVFSVEFTQ